MNPRLPASPSARLTVALVSTQERWHGGEEQARLLAIGLRKAGHDCTVLARRGGAFARRMALEGFAVTQFSGNGRSPWGLVQIRRRLGGLRPHVIHFNDAHALTGAGLASIGLGIGARVVARRLDYRVRWPIRYRALCGRVICVSQAVAEACRQSGIPSRLLRVVHDGVDPGRAASGDRLRGRRTLGVRDDDELLLCVATLTDHKGHIYLLSAMPGVLRERPRALLLLAGDGELRAELDGETRRLDLQGRVRFLGFRDDVPDLMRAADLFVFPSHMEGMGSSLIDAMLAGLPIVTTSAGGIPDVTGSREPNAEPSAWVVPPRDPSALTAAIVDALTSPHRRAQVAQRAQRRAETLFTADRMVEATLAVYRELLAERRG